MTRHIEKTLLLFLSLFVQISPALGHGDLHQQIEEISVKIIRTPNDVQLWLTRADLHQNHRNPKAARLDLLQATKIKPVDPNAFLKLAELDRKRGETALASSSLKTYFTLITHSTPNPSAYREKALLSPPAEAIESWQHYLEKTKEPTMLDFVLAARTAFDSKNFAATRTFLSSGLNHHPKSIQLHHLHARTSLIEGDPKSAQKSFDILSLLFPSLLVKLKYDESLIWTSHHHPARARKALRSALAAHQNLPARVQNNRDMQALIANIKSTLEK